MLKRNLAMEIASHDSILRFPEVKERTGLGRSAIYQKIADGEFPAPVKIGKRASGWSANAVQEWINGVLTGGGV